MADATNSLAAPGAQAPGGNERANNKILVKMLDRLFASLVNGPGLNCRPHNSRQRIDLTQLHKLGDLSPDAVLVRLLGKARKAAVKARVPQPRRRAERAYSDESATEEDAAAAAAERAWAEQQAVLQKLHVIADDARTYEQDTGVHVLNVGFPLLSLPPGAFGGGAAGVTRRILAPIAFIPVTITTKRGSVASVEIACRGQGIDLVVPNNALLAWLEQQTGTGGERDARGGDLFADEGGEDPGREVWALVRQVCRLLEIDPPRPFDEDIASPGAPRAAPRESVEEIFDVAAEEQTAMVLSSEATPGDDAPGRAPEPLTLLPAPRADETPDQPAVLFSAVIGLFPTSNQGLLRDMQEMVRGESLDGPVESFIRLGVSLDVPPEMSGAAPDAPKEPVQQRPRAFDEERMVAAADPCQSRAVRLARESRGLVIHGPPGTGKSQTITNIIGDHLSRGQRVLLVCEKRTALDVVANRLEHMGLDRLVAIVHDPQRDQRELYRRLRDQLEMLAEAQTDARSEAKLQKVNDELQKLHAELTAYRAALANPDSQTGASFHDLVGHWLATPADSGAAGVYASAGGPGLSGPALSGLNSTRLVHLDAQADAVREIVQRAAEVDLAKNPWRDCAAVGLADVLSRPADWYRSTAARWQEASTVADATADPQTPPFAPAPNDLAAQAEARIAFAKAFDGLLDVIAPEALQRWAGRDLPSIHAVRAKLSEAGGYIQALKAGPLDGELLSSLLAARAGTGRALPTLTEMGEYRDLVQRYADAYATWSVWVSRVRQGAPHASLPTIARWIDADEKTFDAALKTLKAAEPLASQAAAAPLDQELLAQYRRQPFDMTRLLAWQAALDTYLPKATGLFSFLHGVKKRAAAPATEFFGLAVGPDSARRVRDFLAGLRSRLELRYALQKAIGAGTLPQLPDDEELLATFNDHHGTVQASADLQRRKPPAGSHVAGPPANVNTVTDETDLVHRLIGAELNQVAPLFAEYGLFPNPQNTTRVKAFLQALTVRLLLQDFHHRLLGGAAPEILMGDDELEGSIKVHSALLDLILKASREPLLDGLAEPLRRAMAEPETQSPRFIEGLYKSPARAKAVGVLERELAETNLFTPQYLASVSATLRNGGSFTDVGRQLAERVDTLEGVVRVREGVSRMEFGMKQAVQALLEQSASADEAWAVMRKAVLTAEITRRLRSDPLLQNVDGKRVATAFQRYRELDERKRDLVRDQIFDQWVTQQKERLVVETGTRLNALGAELKRRLTLRGERAMRLRQVVAVGRRTPGGDPLFDLCPVWMVSPETAAQVFPREPVFDVVVFDEASQCRLEEALPVLTRGGRIVIAGDPKQLPPTRFFESAVSQSDNEQIETDQQLFEMQQGEVEDLLGAALGLDIQQCYLDVHYRSRNADLIAFSNKHFYGSRLQPLPGHPSRLPPHAPVRLHRVEGVYHNRENDAEAQAVCELVSELLSRKDPPSIGVACFNLQQRDLIVDKLDAMAAADERFAKRLEKARERAGAGSFEGLFVKNLENVQGDERDHIIISTTYGPDKGGRFYRRFGPLGMSGGGRRLNVLVTRARDEVHLVTSIPREAYRSLPELESGQTPGGAWLLFAYLKFAEELQRGYARDEADSARPQAAQETRSAIAPHALARPVTAESPLAVSQAAANANGDGEAPPQGAAPDTHLAQRGTDLPADPDQTDDVGDRDAPVRIRPTRTPSPFAQSLAQKLAEAHGVRSDVYWGNDGFCVDVALRDSADPARMTIGVLCDAARFTAAEDPVEWDVFRTAVLETQGWELHRVWTPHFFRDPQGAARTLLRAAGQSVAREGVEGRR